MILSNINKKSDEYKKYIEEHRENVKRSFRILYSMGILHKYLSNPDINILFTEVEHHDLSKYSDEEFEAYRNYFYPKIGERRNLESYNNAWEHHYRNNDHHWEYWYNKDDNTFKDGDKKIPYMHMCIDWMAMSIKFNNSIMEYYNSHIEKIKIDPLYINYVESIISDIDGILEGIKNSKS
jgi:hypothetical protein